MGNKYNASKLVFDVANRRMGMVFNSRVCFSIHHTSSPNPDNRNVFSVMFDDVSEDEKKMKGFDLVDLSFAFMGFCLGCLILVIVVIALKVSGVF